MGSLVLLFLLSTLHATVLLAQQRHSNISLGSSLTPITNSSWFSPSKIFAFGFYEQTNGYAIGVYLASKPKKTAVWTANRDNNPIVPSSAVLLLTNDGRMIVQQPQSKEIEIINPSQTIGSASMLDNGNFVLYNSDQKVIWQSFDYPTNTLLAGQHLAPGKVLFASASDTDDSVGIFCLIMQLDGYLVQYPTMTEYLPQYAYYTAGADAGGNPYAYYNGGGSNVTLNLDDDGHLYLTNSSTNIKDLWGGNHRERTIYLLKIDVDGIFRVYSHSLDHGNRSEVWSSTEDRCAPKGICGTNAFCTSSDGEFTCKCLQGFDFVKPDNKAAGCERNFTAQTCKEKDGYMMMSEPMTNWEDDSYAIIMPATPEKCEQACLMDCNCEAVQFKDTQCRKQKLPLRFGRKNFSDSNILLIKVGKQASITGEIPVYGYTETEKNPLQRGILIVGIFLAIFALMALGITGILINRKHVWVYKKLRENLNDQMLEVMVVRPFSYSELEQATCGFSEELGKGSFGVVYKGILPDNDKMVAVKRLENVSTEGEIEFQTEVKVIGKTHHRNLVRLLGYCQDGSKRLLVYEHMSNGSLADILFNQEKRPTWIQTNAIARDIARGLLYLHDECETQIIHCDIKPQNILMDDNFCAKISDFGLAKLLKQDQSGTYTGIRGTRGYVAPEWHSKSLVTVKADVYSFGIVLLELIFQRKSVDWSLPDEEAILEEWVYDCFSAGEVSKLIQDGEVNEAQLDRMVRISMWCIQDEPSLRPSMKKVLLMLEGTVEIPQPPNPKSFLSTL